MRDLRTESEPQEGVLGTLSTGQPALGEAVGAGEGGRGEVPEACPRCPVSQRGWEDPCMPFQGCTALLFCCVSGEGSLPKPPQVAGPPRQRGDSSPFSPRAATAGRASRPSASAPACLQDSPAPDAPLSPRVPYRGIRAAEQTEHQQEDPAARVDAVAAQRVQGRGLGDPGPVPRRRPRHGLPGCGRPLKERRAGRAAPGGGAGARGAGAPGQSPPQGTRCHGTARWEGDQW